MSLNFITWRLIIKNMYKGMKYELLEYELSHLEAHQTNLRDESVDLGMSKHILLVHPPEVVPFYLFFYRSYSIDGSN